MPRIPIKPTSKDNYSETYAKYVRENYGSEEAEKILAGYGRAKRGGAFDKRFTTQEVSKLRGIKSEVDYRQFNKKS